MVGTAESSKAGPYNDPSYEIWCVSARASVVTRADRWFELHRLEGEPVAWANKWRATLRDTVMDGVKDLYMIWPEDDLAPGRVRRYPVDAMVARFGSFFMTSSFAWMMALAIDELCPIVDGRPTVAEKGSEIVICGINMEYGTEYREQRVGMRHFMELAKTLGIEVTRLVDSGLAMEPVPYPMWQDDPLLCKIALRAKEVHEAITDRDNAIRLTRESLASARGALNEVTMMLAPVPILEGETSQPTAYDPKDREKHLTSLIDSLVQTSTEASKDLATYEGRSEELGYLKDYLQS
jgi:hypothetical protein